MENLNQCILETGDFEAIFDPADEPYGIKFGADILEEAPDEGLTRPSARDRDDVEKGVTRPSF